MSVKDNRSMPVKDSRSPRRMRGFEHAGGLIGNALRNAAEQRGFAEQRLLTHWDDIVGTETAAIARPIKVSYGKAAFGATLTLLTTGANAPVLQMQLPRIRERVNAVYGYSAISAIHITQTAPTGFAEGHTPFSTPKPLVPAITDRAVSVAARAITKPVTDEGLRSALEALGRNVISRQGTQKGSS